MSNIEVTPEDLNSSVVITTDSTSQDVSVGVETSIENILVEVGANPQEILVEVVPSAQEVIIEADSNLQNINVEIGETAQDILVEVALVGDKGDKGEVGSDLNYVYDQAIPSLIWNVTHSLDKRPSVFVVDSAGTVVIGKIEYIDNNNVILTFNGSFSGYAYFN